MFSHYLVLDKECAVALRLSSFSPADVAYLFPAT